MVKLIATDMDGTLLDDKKRLPAEFPQLLKVLTERKVALLLQVVGLIRLCKHFFMKKRIPCC